MRIKYMIKCLFAMMAMMAFACQKDNQTFTYDKLNEVTVSPVNGTYTVSALDSFVIRPTLRETLPAGEEYSYTWRVVSSTNFESTILSTDRDLKMVMNLSPDKYNLYFKATSKKTGISVLTSHTLTVNGAFYKGWLVVHNKEGKARLSFIRADDTVIPQPAETVNNTSYPGKALSAYAGIERGMSLLFFFTDQGAYRFNANDFMQNAAFSSLFPTVGSPFKTAPSYSPSNSSFVTDQYVVADGGLYTGLGPAFYAAEVLKPFSDRLPGDYSLYPGVFPVAVTSTYFYDNKHKKFMVAGYLSREINTAATTSGASFNLANVGKTMIAYDNGVAVNEFFYVMENETGRSLLSTVDINPGINQLIEGPGINNATAFAMSSQLRQLFYATGSRIYRYNITAKTSELIYSFPAGTIKDIKMMRGTSQTLAVALNKGTIGEVYHFDIDIQGNFKGDTYTKKFEGFGTIEQINFRRSL